MPGTKITNRGLDRLIDDLRELSTTGIARAQAALDAALEVAAEERQTLAHVSHDKRHSGALRASQTFSSDHDPRGWTGTISYGSRGAEWEIARGGDHAQFIDRLGQLTDRSFEEAIDLAFRDLT